MGRLWLDFEHEQDRRWRCVEAPVPDAAALDLGALSGPGSAEQDNIHDHGPDYRSKFP